MTGTVRGGLLWCRAALVAAVACFVGAVGHVLADGLLPGPLVMLALVAATTVLAAAGLARPASALRLTVLVGGGQALVHLDAQRRRRPPRPAPRDGSGGRPRRPSGPGRRRPPRRLAARCLPGRAGTGGVTAGGSGALGELVAHAPMMAAHLAAAAVVALWLAHGERCLWTVLALAAGALLLVLSRPVPAPAPTRMRHHPGPPRPGRGAAARALRRTARSAVAPGRLTPAPPPPRRQRARPTAPACAASSRAPARPDPGAT